MPPQRRSYATPEETFGITRKPLNDWLDFAASGLPRQGPAFSTELEDANIRNQQRELQSMQLQRDLASEQAASQFLSQAAGKNPQGLMRMLAESPEILGSKDAPMIQDYVSQRKAMQEERQAKQPFSNKALVPSIAKSITDPVMRMKFLQRTEASEEATAALDSIKSEARLQEQQAATQQAVLDALSEGAITEADEVAILNSENPMRALAIAKGKAKSTGKIGGKSGVTDSMERGAKLLEMIKILDENGDTERADKLRLQFDAIDFSEAKPPSPSTGAVIPMEAFDTAAAVGAGAATGAGLGDAVRRGLAGEIPTPTAIPDLPPAPPATAAEEKQLAEQQQRGAREAEKQQLADVAWTGVKGTAAARGAEATGPADIIAEARKAVVGGQTTNKRAQRIAALARAYADDRDVNVGTRTVTRIDPGSGVPFDAVEDDIVPPDEALVRELGFEPDAIVGQAPTRAGGPLRDITALEAARAILADAADPFIKLRESRKVAEVDASEEPIIEAELAKARTGQAKTN